MWEYIWISPDAAHNWDASIAYRSSEALVHSYISKTIGVSISSVTRCDIESYYTRSTTMELLEEFSQLPSPS